MSATRAASAPGSVPAAGAGTCREQVLEALSAVYDPELDEPITTLRFISACEVSDHGDVQVRLRLPTPQCAPNFAFLMAADARAAVRRLPGVGAITITLEDHYTGEQINAALARGEGFTGAFPGETEDDDLEALRELFVRKALIARQAKICQSLMSAGASAETVVALSVSELPDSPESRRCLELREQLGIAAGPTAPAFVLPNGESVPVDQLTRWLRMARLVRTGLETNGGMCRSLLEFRHRLASEPEEVRR
jgi:metal-sulfur cluster biosynthetic enzyme